MSFESKDQRRRRRQRARDPRKPPATSNPLLSSLQDLNTMGPKVSVRYNEKLVLKKARSVGDAVRADTDDNVTLMDMIRSFRKPTQQQKRPAQPVSQEEDEDKARVIADVDSSDSDEDHEKVGQHFRRKRKRKSKDLYEILQCARPVSASTPDRQDDESPQLRKSRKSDFSNEQNALDAHAWTDGILEGILGSSPPSPISHKTDDTKDMNPQCGHGDVRRSIREAGNGDKGVRRMGAPLVKGGDGAIRREGDEKRGRGRRVVASPLEHLETFKKQRNFSRQKVAGTGSDSHGQAAEDSAPARLAPSLAWSTVTISSGQTYLGEENIAPHDWDENEFVHYVEVVVQQTNDFTAQELKEKLPSQNHYVGEVTVQAQGPTEVELKEELYSQGQYVDEGVALQDPTEKAKLSLEDEDGKQGEHELPPRSECDAGNQTKLNVGPRQGAGEGSPLSEEDITAGQVQNAALQSLEEAAAADPTAEISESCFSSLGPSQLPEEFVCSQRVGSSTATTSKDLEEGESAEIEEDAGCNPAHGIVEEVCDFSSPGPNQPPEEFVCSQRVDSAGATTFEEPGEGDSGEREEDVKLHPAHGIVEECDLPSPGQTQLPEEFGCPQRVGSGEATTLEKLEEVKSAERDEDELGTQLTAEVSDFCSPGPNQLREEFLCPLRVDSGEPTTFEKLEEFESPGRDEDELGTQLTAEVSDFCSPGQNQPPEEFVCPLRVDSGDATNFQKLESEPAEHEDDAGLAHGILEEVCGNVAASVDYGNNVAKTDDSCEKAGEDALDFPVILSQPRGRGTEEDCIDDTVNGAQGASLKAEIIRLAGEIVGSATESSPPQSEGVESVLPECAFNSECTFNCGDGCDPPVGERSGAAVLDHHLPRGVMTVPLIADAEFEQIESFNYVTLHEEWQNAGKSLNHVELSLFEEDAESSPPRKRKLCDPENSSDQVKRVATEALIQQEVPFGRRVQDISPERALEDNSMEDEYVPTALSKALIERNGERRVGMFPGHVVEERPSMERRSNANHKLDRAIAREKRKALLEEYPQSPNCQKPNPSPRCLAKFFAPLLDGERALTDGPETSPESNCDPATMGESNVCIDLYASEKLGDEESSQDFEPPSKLPCRRKTMSPLSQMELMRASDSPSQPAHESPTQKMPASRLKLTGELASRHEELSPVDCEPIPDSSYLEPNDETGNCEANNGAVLPHDSWADDTEDSCGRQVHGPGSLGQEPARKFSLCLSPNSPSPSTSPESLTADSSQNTSSLDPRDSQSLSATSSKSILKTGALSCKGLCKCAVCSTSRSKAGTAADFIASQMKTFQLIAGRLTMGIQSLRKTIETNLQNPGDTAKIQETLQKSRDVEEAAEKNLTTLLRDCKRYCKLTATKPITMRKILFADEAGKKLCHVKTFQSQSLSKSVLDLL